MPGVFSERLAVILSLAAGLWLAAPASLPGQSFESRLPHVPIRLVQAEPRATMPVERSPEPRDSAAVAAESGLIPLAPPTNRLDKRGGASGGTTAGGALVTVGGSLAVVLGAFFLLVWFTRRALPKAASGLPTEAFEVLGQAGLQGRQSVQLLKVGNKIVLIALTAGGAQPLSEITEPAEIERLVAVCRRSRPDGVSEAFRQVLGPASRDSASPAARTQPTARGTVRRRYAVEV